MAAALLALLLLGTTGASAAPRLPWADNFDDGKLDGWVITDSGDGSVTIDRSQYVSPGCSMHVRSPNSYDSAIAELNLTFNRSESYVVEFSFRYTGNHHGLELIRDYEMCLLLDMGKIQVQEGPSKVRDVTSVNPNTWYRVKVLYDANAQNNTIWVDGTERTTFDRDMVVETVRLGDTFWMAYYGEVFYDDFRLYYEDEPVARPPTWLELPTISAVEDVPVSFDFTPYVWARDMSSEDLTLSSDSPYVTGIVGRTVTFAFPNGVLEPTVALNLSDGRLEAPADVHFTVTPVDDAPVVLAIPPVQLTEEAADLVDLSVFLQDEDTPLTGLTLSCDDPACIASTGLGLTLMFPVWRDGIVVRFNVSDGASTVPGSFEVDLAPRNDAPLITGIGNLTPPYTVRLEEKAKLWLEVHVQDEDDTDVELNVTSSYRGVTASEGGMLYITAKTGDIGSYTATITATDPTGAKATETLTVQVTNVNDPPSQLKIVLPTNRSTVVTGANVTFSVEATDPDTAYGQVLMVTWTSDISGFLNSTTSKDTFIFSTTSLPIGTHIITVTVTDGEYSLSRTLVLNVAKAYVPSGDGDGDGHATFSPTLIAGIVVAVALVVVGVVAFLAMAASRRRREEEARAAPPSAPAAPPPKPGGPLVMEGDLARETADMSSAHERLAAERRASEIASTIPTVVAIPEPTAVPAEVSAEELAERERTRELREVRRALMNLPQGLPTALAGIEIVELATAIMDGERSKTPTGSPLVKIKGKWYRADRTEPDTFMKEWQEPREGAPSAAAPRLKSGEEKLARLEELLISGKVSEETYQELKRKYEQEP